MCFHETPDQSAQQGKELHILLEFELEGEKEITAACCELIDPCSRVLL